MISERSFARGHSDFWEQTLPFGERFARSIRPDRYSAETPTAPNVRAEVAAELSYLYVSRAMEAKSSLPRLGSTTDYSIRLEATRFLDQFIDREDRTGVREEEVAEAMSMASPCLQRIKSEWRLPLLVVVKPVFDGCGTVDSCSGDLIVDSTLFEFKSVTRNFRGPDFRQVLTYLSLNALSPRFEILRVCLVNQRRGVIIAFDCEEFVRGLSGRSLIQVATEIAEHVAPDLTSAQ